MLWSSYLQTYKDSGKRSDQQTYTPRYGEPLPTADIHQLLLQLLLLRATDEISAEASMLVPLPSSLESGEVSVSKQAE